MPRVMVSIQIMKKKKKNRLVSVSFKLQPSRLILHTVRWMILLIVCLLSLSE